MWQFILIGDVVIMGFMIVLVIWMGMKSRRKDQQYHMMIPLRDDKTER